MGYEDFKSEIEKIDNNLSIEKYDEDQIAMIGTTLQDRKAGDYIFMIIFWVFETLFMTISMGMESKS